MLYLVMGGSGSGKSAYAEMLTLQISDKEHRVYLATMQVCDEEGKRRVARHRKLRADKSFRTLEQPKDLLKQQKQWTREDTVLLECMSNLVANEMFGAEKIAEENAVEKKVLEEVTALLAQVTNLVIVTNQVFEDGICYDSGTMAYLRALGAINCKLAELADVVTEVVYTIPVTWKGKREETECQY